MWRPKWLGGKTKAHPRAIGVSCIDCACVDRCPILQAWIEACERPLVIFTFHCSEFKEAEHVSIDG